MSTNSSSKINQLLQKVQPGTLILSKWLKENGISNDLQHRYLRNGWLTAAGHGAFIRTNDTVLLPGAVYSLQVQLGKKVHIGARSALSLQGLSHYLELYQKETIIVIPPGYALPRWFSGTQWDTKPVICHSSILPWNTGLIDWEFKTYMVKISGPVRALAECLEMIPDSFDLQEAYEIMESLYYLIPEDVQEVLEQCRSAKVNRLFLLLAEKAGHPWLDKLQPERIHTGKGKMSLFPKGVFNNKYQVTLPNGF